MTLFNLPGHCPAVRDRDESWAKGILDPQGDTKIHILLHKEGTECFSNFVWQINSTKYAITIKLKQFSSTACKVEWREGLMAGDNPTSNPGVSQLEVAVTS